MRPRAFGGLSLRARLLVISMALLLAGLTANDVVALGTLREHLVARVDSQIRPIAGLLSRIPPALLARTADTPGVGSLPGVDITRSLDLINEISASYLAEDGGEVLTLRTLGRGAAGPRLPRLDRAGAAGRTGRIFEVPDADGHGRWRVVVMAYRAGSPLATGLGLPGAPGTDGSPPGAAAGDGRPPATVVVAASLDEVDSAVARLAVSSLLTAGALLVLLTVAGWYAVRAGLRPLRRIEQVAVAIAAGDLAHRVPDLARPRTEVGRLSAALNGMLAQLERAFAARARSEARMRRFVTDVSHELRTPLFGIKGFTELYRMGGLSGPADVEHAMGRIESESGRLARLAEDLLLLARLGEDPTPAEAAATPMDLRTLAADARHDLRALDPAREVTLTGPGGAGPPASAPVLGDEARLRRVVSNLVGNVVAHTPAGTAVRIGVGTREGTAVLEIADRGPGMTAQQAGRVFERFYRVDRSRSRDDGGGAGLGLAIVRSLVAAHGGRVELETGPGSGATFRVMLPAA